MYQSIIEKALWGAELLDDDKEGFIAKDTMDGMVVKIWYRTVGDKNVLVRSEVVTDEAWDWERAGVTNNADWRKHLNRSLWADYRCGLDYNNKKHTQEI